MKIAILFLALGSFLVLAFQNCGGHKVTTYEALTKDSASSQSTELSVDLFSISSNGSSNVTPGSSLQISLETSNATSVAAKIQIAPGGTCSEASSIGNAWSNFTQIASNDLDLISPKSFSIPTGSSQIGCTYNVCVTAFNQSSPNNTALLQNSATSRCASYTVVSASASGGTIYSLQVANPSGSVANVYPLQSVNFTVQGSHVLYVKSAVYAQNTPGYTCNEPTKGQWIDWTASMNSPNSNWVISSNNNPNGTAVPAYTFSATWTHPDTDYFSGCTHTYCVTAASSASEAAEHADTAKTKCNTISFSANLAKVTDFQFSPNPITASQTSQNIYWSTSGAISTVSRWKSNGSCQAHPTASAWLSWGYGPAVTGDITHFGSWNFTVPPYQGCSYDVCITARGSYNANIEGYTKENQGQYNMKCQTVVFPP